MGMLENRGYGKKAETGKNVKLGLTVEKPHKVSTFS